ncbi:MAG: polyprenol monophosphomannose synthase [Candidatus Omnitrophica bacterium]|nr:polyprenol monophosphomannose synthase [Candidatus Omnitrophota bacterium]
MLSVIIPTYNEIANIPELISSVDRALSAAAAEYEILIMDDDSPDGTAKLAADLQFPRVRVVNRRGRTRGLASAVIDGFREANGNILAVMDADLSHPPEVLVRLHAAVLEGALLAVASRYVPGGGVKNWPVKRQWMSRIASWAGRILAPVNDSSSGYFMFRREVIEGLHLDPLGFKIGLEIFVKGKHQGRIREVPYVFSDRLAGKSKLSAGVMGAFAKHYWKLLAFKLYSNPKQ